MSTSSQAQQGVHKAKKVSVACAACKQKKTRCSGVNPCEACKSRGTNCEYDALSDQRRKIANQRNIENLSIAQAELANCKQLIAGVIATLRVGSNETIEEMIEVIRSGDDLSQLAAHVRNACRTNSTIGHTAFSMNMALDVDGEELPSISQHLGRSTSSERGGVQQTETTDSSPSVTSPTEPKKTRKERARSGRMEDVINPTYTVVAKPWTEVTDNDEFVSHLMTLWFTWAHPWWHWMDEHLFLDAMRAGDMNSPICTPALVNMILADSCLLDTIEDDETEPHVELRHQFYAEALHHLASTEATTSLATVQAMGVQWTYLNTNGQDRIGHEVLKAQLVKSNELEQWRVRLGQDRRGSTSILEQVDRSLDRLMWTLYTLNSLSLMSFRQTEPPKPPIRPQPAYDHRSESGPDDGGSISWVSYPEQKKAKFPFHADCHLACFFSLATTTNRVESLLFRRHANGEPIGRQQFYDTLEELRTWGVRLPDCMQISEYSTPHVLGLHSALHSSIIIVSKEAAAAEAGQFNRPTIISTPQSDNQGPLRSIAMSSALAISDLAITHARNWGHNHFPVIIIQPICVALFTLLESLDTDHNYTAFTNLCYIMRAASLRFRVAKGVLRLLQRVADDRGIKLSNHVQQLLATDYSRNHALSSNYATKVIDLDDLLGKWEDFKLHEDVHR